jgi:RING-type zinc-finger
MGKSTPCFSRGPRCAQFSQCPVFTVPTQSLFSQTRTVSARLSVRLSVRVSLGAMSILSRRPGLRPVLSIAQRFVVCDPFPTRFEVPVELRAYILERLMAAPDIPNSLADSPTVRDLYLNVAMYLGIAANLVWWAEDLWAWARLLEGAVTTMAGPPAGWEGGGVYRPAAAERAGFTTAVGRLNEFAKDITRLATFNMYGNPSLPPAAVIAADADDEGGGRFIGEVYRQLQQCYRASVPSDGARVPCTVAHRDCCGFSEGAVLGVYLRRVRAHMALDTYAGRLPTVTLNIRVSLITAEDRYSRANAVAVIDAAFTSFGLFKAAYEKAVPAGGGGGGGAAAAPIVSPSPKCPPPPLKRPRVDDGDVECPVCYEEFAAGQALACFTHCGHTICMKCVTSWKAKREEAGRPLVCPHCLEAAANAYRPANAIMDVLSKHARLAASHAVIELDV